MSVPKPNEFHRSMTSGECAVCGWKAAAQRDHDPDFASNEMAIHFAESHVEKLPWAFVREIEKRLAEGGIPWRQ
jgi:hypothetical protein